MTTPTSRNWQVVSKGSVGGGMFMPPHSCYDHMITKRFGGVSVDSDQQHNMESFIANDLFEKELATYLADEIKVEIDKKIMDEITKTLGEF